MDAGTEKQLASVAEKLASGKLTEGASKLAGILAATATGSTLLGGTVDGSIQWLARVLCDTAMQRMLQAGEEFDNQREQENALSTHLTALLQPLLDDVREQHSQQFLQIIQFIRRTVASQEQIEELLELLERLVTNARDAEVHVRSEDYTFLVGTFMPYALNLLRLADDLWWGLELHDGIVPPKAEDAADMLQQYDKRLTDDRTGIEEALQSLVSWRTRGSSLPTRLQERLQMAAIALTDLTQHVSQSVFSLKEQGNAKDPHQALHALHDAWRTARLKYRSHFDFCSRLVERLDEELLRFPPPADFVFLPATQDRQVLTEEHSQPHASDDAIDMAKLKAASVLKNCQESSKAMAKAVEAFAREELETPGSVRVAAEQHLREAINGWNDAHKLLHEHVALRFTLYHHEQRFDRKGDVLYAARMRDVEFARWYRLRQAINGCLRDVYPFIYAAGSQKLLKRLREARHNHWRNLAQTLRADVA